MFKLEKKMAYYNLKEVKAIRLEIETFKLDRLESLDNANISELQIQFNGAGSDSMPSVLRTALSKILNLRSTVAIHDWDYYKSDGTKQGQIEADNRFFKNGHIEIYIRYAWWKPYRYWSLYKLSVAFKLLQKYGEDSYKSAHEKYKED